MKLNDRKQIIKNIIWNGISILISSIIGFTLTPYVTNNIGIEANGFVTLANTCITYIDIIAVALNAFAARYISMAYHNKNYEEANEFYSSVVIADVILSILLFIPCSSIIWKLQYLLEISDTLVSDIKILFFLVLINWTINVIGTAFTVVAFIKNRASITYRNKGISSILYAITLGSLIYFTKIHVYYMAIGNLIASIFNLYMNYHYTKRFAAELKVEFTKFSCKRIRKLISSGIWNSIGNIGNLLNSGLDLLICNKLLSELVMGQVSVSNQLSKIMTTFTNIFVNAFQPKQLELYAKGNLDDLIKSLKISMKVVGIIGNTFMFCFFVLGKDFLNLWLPGQDIHKLYILTVIVLIGDIVVTTVRPLFFVFTLTDKFKSICWITICSGIVNVVSMFLLIKNTNLEAYAVVGTTTVINFVIKFCITPHLASKYLNLKENVFFPVVARHIEVFLTVTFLSLFLAPKITTNTWLEFLMYVCFFGITGLIIVFMLELTNSERKTLYNIVKAKIE